MNVLKNKFNLQEYDILSVSLGKKEKKPIVFFICEKNKERYLIKTPLENNKKAMKSIYLEYKLLTQRYNSLLNPKILQRLSLRTNYLFLPSISHYIHNPILKYNYINKTIKWLVDFHNEKHTNGIGQIHGDFSPYDIIIKNNRVIVLDWEDYKKNKEQLIDIYYFIFKNTFSETFLLKKEKNISKFIKSLTGKENELHPFLKKYIRIRKNIKYKQERRNTAFKEFLEYEIRKEEENYTIPRRDHFLYRSMYNIIKANEENRVIKTLEKMGHPL